MGVCSGEAPSSLGDAAMPASSASTRLPATTEQALGVVLVQDGLLSAAQLLAVQQYGQEHHLDLRQALLKLKMVAEDRLQSVLLDRVPRVQSSAAPLIVPEDSS